MKKTNRIILLRTGFFLAFVILFLVSCEKTPEPEIPDYENLPATSIISSEKAQNAAELLFNEVNDNELIGIQVCLIDSVEEKWSYSIGSVDLKREENLQNYHIFRIGSITKIYTATLILKLVEEEYLELDQKLSDFYPDFPDSDKISFRNLLNHSSGLIDIFELPDIFIQSVNFPGKHWNPSTIAETCLSKGPSFEPGSRTKYSSANIILLGLIAEKVTGKKIWQLYRQYISDPLELENTSFVPYENPEPSLINGYVHHMALSMSEWYINTPEHLSWATAGHSAGAMTANSEELADFIRALFTGKILSEESLQEMTTFLENKGLGIFRFDVNGRVLWGHSGQLMGFECITAFDPQNQLTYTLCCNTSPYDINALLKKMVNLISK
ncbi:MAG: serine hydrolase domain-containing protein [Bacteroidales bacterium]